MKENTLFHFGNDEIKFSCFKKSASQGAGKCRKFRYFLRRTDTAGIRVRRISSEAKDRYFRSFASAPEMMEWAETTFERAAPHEHRLPALAPTR